MLKRSLALRQAALSNHRDPTPESQVPEVGVKFEFGQGLDSHNISRTLP
ncbi:unnamed protein product [Acidithrix sp. C25]|nr:unnamed protein product [Acidithrix sp. C25]